jgi:predicted Rdx family selenoprotein
MPDLKKGPRGLFDVYADEGIIYSNRTEGGRLPRNEEVIEKLRKYQERARQPARQDRKAETSGAASESSCG